MADASTNPYQSPAAQEDVKPRRWFPRLLLALVGLILLVRGFFVAVGFIGIYLPSAFASGSFMFALFLKDGIYGITALAGATLLVYPSRTGWYFAVAHWVWYLAGDVILVACAILLGWSFPLSPGTPRILFTLVLGVLALAVLFWEPVMNCCGVSVPRRRALAIFSFLALIAAFPLNWFALSRLW